MRGLILILALAACQHVPQPHQSHRDHAAPRIIPGPDGLMIIYHDGRRRFIGMPEPNPPSLSRREEQK